MPSFDVVSQVDLQEVDNAVNQTRKEVGQRYDFKGSDDRDRAREDRDPHRLVDDYKVKAVVEVLQSSGASARCR